MAAHDLKQEDWQNVWQKVVTPHYTAPFRFELPPLVIPPPQEMPPPPRRRVSVVSPRSRSLSPRQCSSDVKRKVDAILLNRYNKTLAEMSRDLHPSCDRYRHLVPDCSDTEMMDEIDRCYNLRRRIMNAYEDADAEHCWSHQHEVDVLKDQLNQCRRSRHRSDRLKSVIAL